MRAALLIPTVVLAAGSVAAGEVAEIFSKHVSVFKPRGEFAQTLIKNAPAVGDGWRLVDDRNSGFKLPIPEDAEVDTKPQGSRVLRLVMAGGPQKPAPVFRVDAFKPEADDPTEVDEMYAEEYADNYPELAFNGKFSVIDSGLIQLTRKKTKLRMAYVGGTYLQGAVPCYRLQCAMLGKDQQLFLTFDCPEKDWAKHAPVVSRMLLAFEQQGRTK